MKCLKCHSTQLEVTNSRKKDFQVWRRRKCKHCGFTFTTNEYVDAQKLLQLQESSRKKQLSPYNRGTLLGELYIALSHKAEASPLTLLETVEQTLLRRSATNNFTVTHSQLHETVTEVLERYDTLAALNYAARARATAN